jgi:hypothetical protein
LVEDRKALADVFVDELAHLLLHRAMVLSSQSLQ